MKTYSTQQIAYHWITFVLILLMIGTGLAYSFDLADSGAIWVHQIAGQALIAVLILRIVMRFAQGTPPEDPNHPAWERRLARVVHVGLYIVMIAFVVTGYISASAETDNALLAPVGLAFARSDLGELILEVHFALKWVLLVLFGLHFVGALKHLFIDRDDTFSRMTFTSSKD